MVKPEDVLVQWKTHKRRFKKAFPEFPDYCCGHASILMAEYISDVKLVEGWFDTEPHVWLRTTDKTIIDLTIGQFISSKNNEAIIAKSHPLHCRYRIRGRAFSKRYHKEILQELRDKGLLSADSRSGN